MEPDTCRVVDVDGQPIRVRGAKPPSDRDRAAIADVVRATQRHAVAEAQRRGPGAEAIQIGRQLYAQHRIRAIRARAKGESS